MDKLTLCQKDKGERLFTIIREGIDGAKKAAVAAQSSTAVINQQQISIADELTKLATLKRQGIISEMEFTQMKQDLLKKMHGVTRVPSENKSISSFDKHIAYRA
jgi:hypothetical protein